MDLNDGDQQQMFGGLQNFKSEDHMGIHCEYCGKTFSSIAVMMEHRRIHTGERPYGCTICNKRFTQKAHLIIHKRTHTGEKPYACHICHKRFAQSSHLTTHKRIHTGEKPYFCPICSAGYSRKQRLEAHILQHQQDGTMIPKISSSDRLAGFSPLTDAGSRYQSLDGSPQGGGAIFPRNSHSHLSAIMDPTGLPTMVSPTGLSADGQLMNIKNEPNDSFLSPTQAAAETNQDLGQDSGNKSENAQGPASSTRRRKPTVVKKLISNSDGDNSDARAIDNETGDITDQDGKAKENNDYDDDKFDGNDQSFSIDEDPSPEDDMLVGEDKGSPNGASGNCVVSTSDLRNAGSGDEADAASVTSDSNQSSSEQSITTANRNTSLLGGSTSSLGARLLQASQSRHATRSLHGGSMNMDLPAIRTNSRVCLVDFTSSDLITHLMSRDDAYHCDYCCVVFQDAAMYHLHRSMHDKIDIRCCNLCGKLSQDKYDFMAHFLSEHK